MFLEFFVCMFCVWQVVEVYRHSSLFADLRSRLDTYIGFIGKLHRCAWCLSVWVSFLVVAAYRCVYGWHTHNPLLEVISVFGWGLAVSRAANLCNDQFYSVCRTPYGELTRSLLKKSDDLHE